MTDGGSEYAFSPELRAAAEKALLAYLKEWHSFWLDAEEFSHGTSIEWGR